MTVLKSKSFIVSIVIGITSGLISYLFFNKITNKLTTVNHDDKDYLLINSNPISVSPLTLYARPLQTFPLYDELIDFYFKNIEMGSMTKKDFNYTLNETVYNQWNSRGASIIVQIIKGQIHVDRGHYATGLPWDKLRFHHLLSRIKVLLSRPDHGLDNLEFILNTHDCPVRSHLTESVPIFSITRCTGMNVIPVPQWFAWRDGSFERWDERMNRYNEHAQMIQWDEKEPKAIFRGNVRPSVLQFDAIKNRLVFVNVTETTVNELGRTKLYSLGKQYPNLLDVGLFGKGLVDGSRQILELINYEFKPPVSMTEQSQRFKYVIYAEGACGWADRLKVLLVSEMLIFMQETPCKEFFSAALKPWVHYVPVSNDFSDVSSKIKWAQENDEKAREIIDNATSFALHYNSKAGWDYYLSTVLKRYAKLQHKSHYSIKKRPNSRRFIKGTQCPNKRNLYCDDADSFFDNYYLEKERSISTQRGK